MPAEPIPPYYSHHIFMFPFKWEIGDPDKLDLDQRTQIDVFAKAIGCDPDQSKTGTVEDFCWERKPFKLNRPIDYNEYAYFYDYVNEAIYDLDDKLLPSSVKENRQLIRHFEYQLPPETYYRIQWSNYPITNPPYCLKIDSILLNLYNTGVGIISFHLKNTNHPALTDIQKINQYGRRIYPPFLAFDTDRIASENDLTFGTDSTQFFAEALGRSIGSELPYSIQITNSNGQILHDLHDNFSAYGLQEHYRKDPFRLPGFISNLFPANALVENEADQEESKYQRILIKPVLDDRMFVVSVVAHKEFSEMLKTPTAHLTHDDWYKLVFVDGGFKTCQNAAMSRKLLRKHSYTRWSDWGTLYGVSRYSFIGLCDKSTFFGFHHVRSIYYKMAELVLVQRACLQKFSDEVTHISLRLDDAETADEARTLNKMYIRFVNKIYFREVTAQEQGIELYDKLQEVMRLDQSVKDLDHEIQKLHDHVQLVADERSGRSLNQLTLLAGLISVPSLLISFFGLGLIDVNKYAPNQAEIVVGLVGLGLLALLIGALFVPRLTLPNPDKDWVKGSVDVLKKWITGWPTPRTIVVSFLLIILLALVLLPAVRFYTNGPVKKSDPSSVHDSVLIREVRSLRKSLDSLRRQPTSPASLTSNQP